MSDVGFETEKQLNDIVEVVKLNALIINHHSVYKLCCALEQHGRFETLKAFNAKMYALDTINESCFIENAVRILYHVELSQWGQIDSEHNGVATNPKKNRKPLSRLGNDKQKPKA